MNSFSILLALSLAFAPFSAFSEPVLPSAGELDAAYCAFADDEPDQDEPEEEEEEHPDEEPAKEDGEDSAEEDDVDPEKWRNLALKAMLPVDMLANRYIDDRALRATFERKLGAQRSAGMTIGDSDLKKGLERDHAEVEIGLAKAGEKTLSTAELVRLRADSAVLVGSLFKCSNPRCGKWHVNSAGGIAIAPDVVATNHHVVSGRETPGFGVMTRDGRVFPVVEVLAASEADDAALLRVDTGEHKLSPAPLSSETPVGGDVVAISNPNGRHYMVTEGIVARYYMHGHRERQAPRMAITADYAKGSSGSPIFNAKGNIAGMVSSTQSIYYDHKDGVAQNLQMVIKSCVPAESILKLAKRAETVPAGE